MNWGPPVFAHGILQARILEWVAISFSRGSSQSRDRTHVSCIAGRFSCIADRPSEMSVEKLVIPSTFLKFLWDILMPPFSSDTCWALLVYVSVQFSSVAKSCPTHCDPMDCSTPGFPVLRYLPELAQTHVHWVSDAIQPSHPLSSPSPALNLSQGPSPLQWVSSSHHMAKGLKLQLQHQSFQWKFRVDFL